MPEQSQDTTNLTLQWALYYHDLGWSVVPGNKLVNGGCSCRDGASCPSPGKHPAIVWAEYQNVRATKEQLKKWFEGSFKSYNVGIVTGPASGNMFVVDVDEGPGKPGSETLHDLQMQYDDIPDTTQAITGGGGRHYMLLAPHGFTVKTDRNILGPGVDTRGSGGYFVVAPSLHQSGRYYVWDEDYHPARVKPAAAPEWLLDLIGTAPNAARVQNHSAMNQPEVSPFGMIQDGREKYMGQVICGCIAGYVRENGALPDPDETFRMAWPTYSRKTKARGESLEADGRGETLMKQRIGHFLRRAESGAFPVFQTIADEIANAAFKAGFEGVEPEPEWDKGNTDYPFPLTWFNETKVNLDVADFVEGLLCDGQMSIVYGNSGCGKTFFMTDIAFRVATGSLWRDRAVDQGGVIYVSLEGGDGIFNRIEALKEHFPTDDEKVPLGVVKSSINLLSPGADTDKLIRLIKICEAEIGRKIRLVVIDTLSRALHGGNENSPEDMGALVINADKIRQATGAHFCFIHHSGKNIALGARGHSLLRAATDTEIEVSREEGSPTSVAKVTKQREIDSEGTFVFKLKSIELGTNRRGKSVTSCIVEEVSNDQHDSAQSRTKTSALNAKEQSAYEKILNIFTLPGFAFLTTPISGMQPQRCVTRAMLRSKLAETGIIQTEPGKKDDKVLTTGARSTVHRILVSLEAKKRIGMTGDLVWLLNSEAAPVVENEPSFDDQNS